jgi:hypothetical protein
MQYRYSQKLRERLKAYFATRLAWPISDSEADLYLDSLADFYAFFERRAERRPPPSGRATAERLEKVGLDKYNT